MSNTYASARRHPWLLLAVLIVGLSTFMLISNVFGADNSGNNKLELDANVKDDAATGIDWEQVCAAVTGVTTGNGYIDEQASLPTGVNPAICKGDSYLTSPTVLGVDTTFFDSNKDIEDINGTLTGTHWACKSISHAQDKTEVLNAYAAQVALSTQTLPGINDSGLFLGFERVSNNGTEFQGAWFLKNKTACDSVSPGGTGGVWTDGTHAEWHIDLATKKVANTCNAAGEPGLGTAPCNGDLLVIVNHATGGANTEVRSALWAPDQACDNLACPPSVSPGGTGPSTNKKIASWPLLPLEGNTLPAPAGRACDGTNTCVFYNAKGSDCQSATPSLQVCATTNDPVFNPTTPTDACIITPWLPGSVDTVPNDGKPCDTGANGPKAPVIDQFQFVEGYINLNAVFGEVPCFSTVVFEGRTSAEFTATLKDYASGDFDTCGTIIVHKETDPEDASRSFGYTTTGDGLSAFSLTDDGFNELGCDYKRVPPAADDCGANGTVVFTSIVPGTVNTITETDPTTGTPPFDFQNLTCQVVSGSATVSPLAPGSTTNTTAGRTATITMGVQGVVECLYQNRQRGTILIHKVTSKGNANLAGACFSVTGPSPATTVGRVCDENITNPNGTNNLTDTDTGATGGGFICIENVVPGTYTVAETSGPAGYKTDSSTPTASVTDTTSCATRKANLATQAVTFTNIPLSEITVLFKSLSDNNTAGTGNTKAQIVCKDASNAVVVPNAENNADGDGTPGDSTPPEYDDFNEVFGNGTTTLVPGVYTCTIDVDP